MTLATATATATAIATVSLSGFAAEANATDILHKLAAISHLQAQSAGSDLGKPAGKGSYDIVKKDPPKKTPAK